jgi:hypothetical protein
MTGRLRHIITASDSAARNQSLDAFARAASLAELLAECDDLENFRQHSENLYERVRALFFLYAIHRFHLPSKAGMKQRGHVPFKGYGHLLQRRFEEALEVFLAAQVSDGPSDGISSALAGARCGEVCAPSAATNGCSAWDIPQTSRCASAPS